MYALFLAFMIFTLFTSSSKAQTAPNETHWYKDSTLYIDNLRGVIGLWRLKDNYNVPTISGDFQFLGTVTDYQSLIDHSFPWNRADFDALADYIYKYDCVVNFCGDIFPITFPRDRLNNFQPQMSKPARYLARVVLNMQNYGLSIMSVPECKYIYVGGGPGGSAPK